MLLLLYLLLEQCTYHQCTCNHCQSTIYCQCIIHHNQYFLCCTSAYTSRYINKNQGAYQPVHIYQSHVCLPLNALPLLLQSYQLPVYHHKSQPVTSVTLFFSVHPIYQYLQYTWPIRLSFPDSERFDVLSAIQHRQCKIEMCCVVV